MANEYKCDVCGKPASVHITRIVNGKKMKIHLCAECAEKMSFSGMSFPQNVLPKIKEFEENVQKTFAKSSPAEVCPNCGADLKELKKGSLFSCPQCYAALGDSIDEILMRMHSATSHIGKSPKFHKVRTLERPKSVSSQELQDSLTNLPIFNEIVQHVENILEEKMKGNVSTKLSPEELSAVQKQASQKIAHDPESMLTLKLKLDKAISEERYEDAAALRDELKKISK